MSRIVDVYSGGRFSHEELDGERVFDGEHLLVTWPDGAVEHVAAIVDHGVERYRAHALLDRHGVPARVLLNSAVEVRRPGAAIRGEWDG